MTWKQLAEHPDRLEETVKVRISFNIEGLDSTIVKTREVNVYVDHGNRIDDDWIREHGMREWGLSVLQSGISRGKEWYPPNKIQSASWELVGEPKRGLPRRGGFLHYKNRTII